MPVVQISLDADTLDLLDVLAAQWSLSREDALREALRMYLEKIRQIDAINEGIREADSGHFASEAEVKAAFAKWGVHVQ
ncbi:MAG: ribbon-helix-helix protein, CopG family [Desulfovibrio sp.]|nr:ribbon-helix-helix protein, CopG family [Desulfovibrio sp.]